MYLDKNITNKDIFVKKKKFIVRGTFNEHITHIIAIIMRTKYRNYDKISEINPNFKLI